MFYSMQPILKKLLDMESGVTVIPVVSSGSRQTVRWTYPEDVAA